MRAARIIALTGLALATFGSLVVSGGYAWYLRSGLYRRYCERVLTESLGGLPAEIGRIVPRSRSAREFQAVRIWLPERRDEAAFCQRAIARYMLNAPRPGAYELDLRGGHCEVSARTWLNADYRFVLESGLRPGFDPNGPTRVVFSGMDLVFDRDRFRVALTGASGVLSFDDPHQGRAAAQCREFNGYVTDQPVTLYAEFSPRDRGVSLDRVELTVPELPVISVGLNELAGLPLRTGSFSGRMLYREHSGSRELTINGRACQWQLAECSAPFFERPWRGVVPELELQELSLVDQQLDTAPAASARLGGWRPCRLRFQGVLTDAVIDDLLAPWGVAEAGGKLSLYIRLADLSPSGIEHFVASGQCTELVLQPVSEALGWGGMTGRAAIRIDDLTITQNRLRSLDATVSVEPTGGRPNWVDRDLLLEVLRRTLGFSLPGWLAARLPERVEYTQLGVRFDVKDEVLYVFGTHGPRGKTILTLSIEGQELPAVFEPETPIDLRRPLDKLRTWLAAYLAQRLTSTQPGQPSNGTSGPAAAGSDRPRPDQSGLDGTSPGAK